MKRKSLLLLLLLALVAPWAALGQSVVTIGSGTATSQYLPGNSFYNYAISQQIYTADEIGGSGNITSISFYNTQGTGSNNARKFKIYMAHTDKTSFSSSTDWIGLTASDLVYQATSDVTLTPNTWTSFTLATPFAYNGTSNLVVVVIDNSGDYTSSSTGHNLYRVFSTTGNQALYAYGDGYSSLSPNGTNGSTNLTGTLLSSKNQIQLGIILCSTPTNFAVVSGSETASSVDLSWTGDNDNYIIEYAKTSSAVTSTTTTTETRTILNEGFESGSMPTGWTTSGNGTWSVSSGDDSSSTGTHSGTYNAKITHGTTNNVTYLITSAYDLSSYTNVKLTCWYINRSWAGDIDGFGVYYRIGTTGSWQELFSTTSAHSSYTQTAELSLPSQSNVQIGFKHTDKYGYGVALDDILIKGDQTVTNTVTTYDWHTASNISGSPYTLDGLDPETEYMAHLIGVCGSTQTDPTADITFTTTQAGSCPKPTSFQQVANTEAVHQAQLTWNQSGEVGQWQLVYSTNESFNPDNATPTLVSTKPYTITGLNQETTYYAYVRAYCSQNEQSEWSNMCTFSTISGHQAPTSVAANAVTAHTATISWQGVSTNDHHASYELYYSTTNTAPGNNPSGDTYITGISATSQELTGLTHNTTYYAWVRDNCGTDGYSDWASKSFTTVNATVAPTVTYEAVTAHTATVKWTGASANDHHASFDLYYSTTNTAPGDNPSGDTYFPGLTTTSKELTDLAHNTTYYAWVRDNCGNDGYSSWASTSFTTVNATVAPTVTYEAVTAHTATVKWTGASANDHHASFDFYYSTTNTAPGDNPSGDTYFPGLTTTSQELSGLDPETTYYAWVRDNCGADGYSSWASTSFTTDIACHAPTNLAVANITGHEAQVSWTGYSDSYEVQYREASSITYDFEDGTQGWTTIDADGHGDAWSCYNNSNYSHGGSCSMQAIYNYDYAHQDYLVSPAIPLGGSVSFYAKKSGDYSDTFRVYLSTSGNTSASNFTIELTNGNVTPTTDYVQYTYNLSSYSGTGYVAIVYTARANQGWLYVDDVTVTKGGAVGEWQTVTVNNESCTLEDLDPETIYEWQVRGNCGEEGYSAWSSGSFTTDVACPAPTNLAVSNITGHAATINWNGSSDSYNVRYGMVVETSTTFDFENQAIPSSWTNDATYPWVIASSGHGSSYSMKSGNSGNHSTTSSIEVPVELANDGTISFYCLASCESSSSYWDYGIFYIDGDQKDSFLHVTDWQYKTYQLTAGTHTLKWTFTKDGSGAGGDDCFYVDDITITSSSVEEWTTTTSSTNSVTLTDLQPETTYQVQVQGNCGNVDGESAWTNAVSFTTTVACPVPYDLMVSEITPVSAILTWTGESDSYNVRYGLVVENSTTFDFENQSIPSSWTNDATYPWAIASSGHGGSYSMKSGNGGNNSTTSSISYQVTVDNEATLTFWAKISSESGWDEGYFSIDGVNKIEAISGSGSWIQYTYTLTAGTHTLRWYYTKDSSNHTNDDCFYVDDITITSSTVEDWTTINNVTSSSYTLEGLAINTTYNVQVQGVCDGTPTDWSTVSNFTTAAGYTVAVSVNNSLHGSATITYQGEEVDSPAEITPNASVTVTATAAVGYAFDYWGEYNATTEEYDPIEGAEAVYTIENIAANHDLKAFFVESKHWLTIVTQPSNAGTVTVTVNGETYTDSEVEIPEGADAALSIVAEEGYEVNVINVTGEGSSVEVYTTLPATEVTAEFTMGSEDATLTVAFLVPTSEFVFDAEDGYEGDESGHWFLFTSPLNGAVSPEEVDNLTSNPDDPEAGYDLYMFDQTGADNGNEWVNYKDSEHGGGFDIVAGTGYLYASEYGTTLTFHGTAYEGDGVITITNESENKWHGWNLVGNPYYYAEEAWSSLPYYSMNNGAELMSHTAAESLAPMEGFFVYSEDAEGTVTVSTENPNAKSASLVLNVSRGRGLLDRAIVSFGDSNTLPKFQLNPSHTKVYIPREERDYAIVSAEDEMGEMPVSFKAEKSGSYTISVTAEGVSFGYLHLIDNMTGNDVDLLQTSSYTFNALDTDYASRFKLVFATGNATGDNFAFYSNGSWVISNEGEATLQVVDVTGRVLRSESVNGCTSVSMSAAPGVYMLRLINGDNVKVQKVVVRR